MSAVSQLLDKTFSERAYLTNAVSTKLTTKPISGTIMTAVGIPQMTTMRTTVTALTATTPMMMTARCTANDKETNAKTNDHANKESTKS
jgi:L-cysteine desulfidase